MAATLSPLGRRRGAPGARSKGPMKLVLNLWTFLILVVLCIIITAIAVGNHLSNSPDLPTGQSAHSVAVSPNSLGKLLDRPRNDHGDPMLKSPEAEEVTAKERKNLSNTNLIKDDDADEKDDDAEKGDDEETEQAGKEGVDDDDEEQAEEAVDDDKEQAEEEPPNDDDQEEEEAGDDDDAGGEDKEEKALSDGKGEKDVVGVHLRGVVGKGIKSEDAKLTARTEEKSGDEGKQIFPDSYLGEPPSPDHDFTAFQPLGGDRFAEWKDGESPYEITATVRDASDELARIRREHIKNAMKHAWAGYKKYAFGFDELKPISKGSQNNWGGMGTTLVDSLDTLWLMGMKDEFWEGRDWVRDHLSHDHNKDVSVFETTIRSLGGLLGAYDWSGDKVFLEKADDLGKRLANAFDSPSGFPFINVNLKTGNAGNRGWSGSNAILAEGGTLQVEFRYLGRATGKTEYARKAERVFEVMEQIQPANGLYPNFIRNKGPKPQFGNDKITFGAMGDSIYEYMLKIWLQGGKKEMMYRNMYDKAIQGMHDELLQKSSPNGLAYIADKNNGRLDHKMDHLVCFMGGSLALGAYTDPEGLDSERAQRDLRTGKQLAYTCYQMYARMKTGIAAEFVQFGSSEDFVSARGAPHYLLRPETAETFFILHQLTGDPVYREWGWEVFQAIERFCKTEVAYGKLRDVTNPNATPGDSMESFFLAETLKYLYLLQDPDTEVDVLNKHVFNTEAHPLRRFEFTPSAPPPQSDPIPDPLSGPDVKKTAQREPNSRRSKDGVRREQVLRRGPNR